MCSLFKKILTICIATFFPIFASAAFIGSSGGYSGSALVTEEYENFYLMYRSPGRNDFGAPMVGGDTVFFLPDNMSVSQRGHYGRAWGGRGFGKKRKGGASPYNSFFGYRKSWDTWTTSIGIVPKEGFDISTLTLIEQGDYAYKQNLEGGEGNFSITARLFIRDIDDPSNFDFLKLDESFTETSDVHYEKWEISESFDISNFTDGFWLTIQNTLHIDGHRPYNAKWDAFKNRDRFQKDRKGDGKDRHRKGKDGKHGWSYGGYGHGWHSPADKLFLQKKFVGVEFGGGKTEVPLPAAIGLFLASLGMLGLLKRTQKQA